MLSVLVVPAVDTPVMGVIVVFGLAEVMLVPETVPEPVVAADVVVAALVDQLL